MITTTVTKAEKKGKVRGANVRIAENGFTVECDREPIKEKGQAGNCCWEPTKPAVFDGPDAGAKMLQYIADELGVKVTIALGDEAAEAA